jgi:hypothetical protein
MAERMSTTGTKSQLDFFESNGSIYTPNKYSVTLYGEYVELAILELWRETDHLHNLETLSRIAEKRGWSKERIEKTLKNFKDPRIHKEVAEAGRYQKDLVSFLSKHAIIDGGGAPKPDSDVLGIELLWTCKSVTIPQPKAKITQEVSIDSMKGISYPLIQGVDPSISVKLQLIEDRKMMIYQFFNALQNQFFNTEFLRAKSSFQKLGIGIKTYHTGDYETDVGALVDRYNQPVEDEDNRATVSNGTNNKPSDVGHDLVQSQRFEFNSIVIESLDDIKLTNDVGSMLEYGISFRCPNPFQKEFSEQMLQGIRNNTSYSTLTKGTNIEYNKSELER